MISGFKFRNLGLNSPVRRRQMKYHNHGHNAIVNIGQEFERVHQRSKL